MKVLIKQLGPKHKTVEDAEDGCAGHLAIPGCLFAYVDVKEKRVVGFHTPNPFPKKLITPEEAISGNHGLNQLYKGQSYVLVHDSGFPESTDEDRIKIKLV